MINRPGMITPKQASGFLICIYALVLTAITGWGMNIYQLLNASFNPITGELVLKIIGVVVFPIGALMGFI